MISHKLVRTQLYLSISFVAWQTATGASLVSIYRDPAMNYGPETRSAIVTGMCLGGHLVSLLILC